MRRAVALLLVASVAAAEPPVSNPPPTPESFEFPQQDPPPVSKKGVHKAFFFTCVGLTVASLGVGIGMGVVAQSDGRSVNGRGETDGFISTGGYIGAVLLLVASLLLIPVTRWND